MQSSGSAILPRRSHKDVVVVDPGVGTARRGISCVSREQVFIAPDNGVLSLEIRLETSPHRSRELQNPELWRKPASDTFHGRDLFAPAAAKLAGGMVSGMTSGLKSRTS